MLSAGFKKHWRLLVGLTAWFFLIFFKPSDPYLVDYMVEDKGFSNVEVYNKIFPVWSYSYPCALLILGLLAELGSSRAALLLGSAALVVCSASTLFGEGLLMFQFTQVEVAFGIGMSVTFSGHIYHLIPNELFQTLTSMLRASSLVSTVLSSLLGQGLLAAFGLRPLFVFTLGAMVTLALLSPLIPRKASAAVIEERQSKEVWYVDDLWEGRARGYEQTRSSSYFPEFLRSPVHSGGHSDSEEKPLLVAIVSPSVNTPTAVPAQYRTSSDFALVRQYSTFGSYQPQLPQIQQQQYQQQVQQHYKQHYQQHEQPLQQEQSCEPSCGAQCAKPRTESAGCVYPGVLTREVGPVDEVSLTPAVLLLGADDDDSMACSATEVETESGSESGEDAAFTSTAVPATTVYKQTLHSDTQLSPESARGVSGSKVKRAASSPLLLATTETVPTEGESAAAAKKKGLVASFVTLCRDVLRTYNSFHVFIWAVWLGCALAVHDLVVVYWQNIMFDLPGGSAYNGAIAATAYTCAACFSLIPITLRPHLSAGSKSVLMVVSPIAMGGCLVVMGLAPSLFIAAVGLVCFHCLFEGMAAIAFTEIAISMTSRQKGQRYSLVFSLNVVAAMVVQVGLQLVVAQVLGLVIQIQFLVFGAFLALLGVAVAAVLGVSIVACGPDYSYSQ